MEEVWKDIVGYEDLYMVSNLGAVMNKKRETILSLHSDRVGYTKVGLSSKGKQVGKFVHRLVAEAFIPNPEEKTDVNHIDGVKSNNNLENLEWNTRSENIIHAVENNLMNPSKGEGHRQSKLTEVQVVEIRKLYSQGVSQSSLARALGMSQPSISYIVNEVNWK